MSEPVRVYLSEFAVLEEARAELFALLDDVWEMQWKETKPQLDALLGATGQEVNIWSNQSTPGDHVLNTSATREECPIRLQVHYHDPRTSPVPGVGILYLWCSGLDRASIRRTEEWRSALLQRCAAEEVEPIDLNSSEMWTTRIKLDEQDLANSVTELSGKILQLFRVIQSFETWLMHNKSQPDMAGGSQ